ncbi:Gypsy retrotransposon integrase 1 [Paramuricea clavata]|uniref:Gypsy retrotransposon integrase 1, partial n=1 Tax=Paramuricea clavata TaxID=317549 RepID=A0A6S7H8F0_PARCT|nr:Gypsy retrotransposon integrase 1 [Paramuricea clavata]
MLSITSCTTQEEKKGFIEKLSLMLQKPLPTTPEGWKYVCTFIDYYTKFVDFYPIKNKSAECVAKCIKTFTCSAYHPQTNGLDERTNQTLKQRLSKLVNEHQNNWCDFLEEVAYSIRMQKQATTKYTPFYLMFGRHPNSPQMMDVVDDCSSAPDQPEESLDEQVSERKALYEVTQEQVQKNVKIAQDKQKKQYQKRKAKGLKTFVIKVGDIVYKRQMKNISRKGGKMEPGWTGPYRVTEIDSSERATLIPLKDNATSLKKKVPYDQLRPYVVSELHKENNCGRGSGSAEDDCKQENNDTDNDDDLPDNSINDGSKLHKNEEDDKEEDDKEDDNNENDNNQNEDNINKNEHNSTGVNGVLESLKNSCKYRGSLFPGEQLWGRDKHINHKNKLNLKTKLNLKGGQSQPV